MGCGKARSVERAKTPHHLKLKILVSKFVPWDLEATRTLDRKATCDETLRQTSRQPPRTSRQAAMIGNELYYTPGSKGEGACGVE